MFEGYLTFFCLLRCIFIYSQLGNLFPYFAFWLATSQNLQNLWICILFLKYMKLAKILT